MIPHPQHCRIAAPSLLSAWARAFAVHFGTTVLLSVPIGTALHYLSGRPRLRRSAGVVAGVVVASAVPLVFERIRRCNDEVNGGGASRTEENMWMEAFLSATFGFHCFFKSMASAFGAFPEGADATLKTWMAWFTSLPEPDFSKGNMRRAGSSEAKKRLGLLLGKLLGTSLCLTILLDAPVRGRPFGSVALESKEDVPLSALGITLLLNGVVGLCFLYFFASFCLDFSALSTTLAYGCACRDGFRNPLLASRSLREAWGERWDLPVQLFLKRSVYVPARKAGLSPGPAVLLTFFCSGLLHEYTFSIHNCTSYERGLALAFFILMGLLMMGENILLRRCPHSIRDGFRLVPTPIAAAGLVLISAIPFERCFIRSWIEAGGLEAVGQMVPHLRCQNR